MSTVCRLIDADPPVYPTTTETYVKGPPLTQGRSQGVARVAKPAPIPYKKNYKAKTTIRPFLSTPNF